MEWLSNGSYPWAAIHGFMACKGIVLDKQPGTRPIATRESWCHLIASWNLIVTGEQCKEKCGADQLCAGLECGTEGALHAVHKAWPAVSG